MASKQTDKFVVVKNRRELAAVLGLTKAESDLMELKIKLSKIAQEAIESSGLTVNDLVEASGVSRSKVSAIKNGATASISIDLMVKVILSTGKKIKLDAA
jgi:predicted XRE-type DNA-binding protein